MLKLAKTMKRLTRRLCAGWNFRMCPSPVLVPLATCVLVMQAIILIQMNAESPVVVGGYADSLRESKAAPVVEMDYLPSSRGPAAQTNDSLDIPNSAGMFDFSSCGCGLHFRVDNTKAELYPVPNVNDKKYLTIGIPTIRRKQDSYIIQTVTSLISNFEEGQHKEVMIVIMVADATSEDRNVTLQELRRHFQAEMDTGMIRVIAAPADLYQDFKITKRTYGQPLNYVEWRSKQNFDYAFLMRYSAPLSLYYMQLEDDVVAAARYITGIRQYIDEQTDSWTCLEFSELGFIGKLYRSRDVERLAQLLLMFFQEQPVDYTFLYFNMLMTQLQKRMRTPTLFQHQGTHSSFPGKIQPLKDRYFDNMVKKYQTADNPEAEIFTSMVTYLNFLPRLPYSEAEGYFWTNGAPTVGDTFTLVFNKPQRLDRVVIETGSESHPDDILVNASLKASLTLIRNPARVECVNDVELGVFSLGRIDVNDLASVIKYQVMCLQIKVSKEHTQWAIIREIAVFVAKENVSGSNEALNLAGLH